MAIIAAKTYGGAVRSSELILSYLKVATRVGMKDVTAAADVLVIVTSLD
jgi:hypothetical protein